MGASVGAGLEGPKAEEEGIEDGVPSAGEAGGGVALPFVVEGFGVEGDLPLESPLILDEADPSVMSGGADFTEVVEDVRQGRGCVLHELRGLSRDHLRKAERAWNMAIQGDSPVPSKSMALESSSAKRKEQVQSSSPVFGLSLTLRVCSDPSGTEAIRMPSTSSRAGVASLMSLVEVFVFMGLRPASGGV